MLAHMFKKRAVPASASKTEQADRADADRPRQSTDPPAILRPFMVRAVQK